MSLGWFYPSVLGESFLRGLLHSDFFMKERKEEGQSLCQLPVRGAIYTQLHLTVHVADQPEQRVRQRREEKVTVEQMRGS